MTDTIGHHSSFHTAPATRPAVTRPVARLALSCGLASALALGAAATATAAQHPAEGKQRRQSASEGAHAGRGLHHQAPADSPAERGRRASSANHPSSGRAAAPSGRSHAPSGRSQAPSAPAQHNPADPAGNNGTIKVDGPAYDDGVDNEPHVSCEVRVTFFGFDEGQTADITFTGQAPTGGGVLLHESAVPTSDDAAGGAGQDADGATRVYTVDDLGLSGVSPHPKQGYHVKVSVDSLEAPGGAKQKVLWIKPCSDTTASQVPTAPGQVPTAPGQLPTVPPAGQAVEPAQPAQAAVAALTLEEAAGPAIAPGEVAAAMEGTAPTAASAPTHVSSSALNPRRAAVWEGAGLSTLPHTGVDGLGALLLTGLGAVAAGGALQLARRRRLSTTS